MSAPERLDTNFQKAEDSPGFMLWKASNLLQRLHVQCLSDLDVTPTQFSVMTCLVYLSQEGPVTPTRISEHAGIDKMMVSDMVKALEKKGLLTRSKNESDGRSFFVSPTAKGVRITNSAVRKVEATDRKFFESVDDIKSFHQSLVALVRTAD